MHTFLDHTPPHLSALSGKGAHICLMCLLETHSAYLGQQELCTTTTKKARRPSFSFFLFFFLNNQRLNLEFPTRSAALLFQSRQNEVDKKKGRLSVI